MGLSKGFYKWAWDVVEGCKNGCDYCFAAERSSRLGRDFTDVKFYESKINEPYKVDPSRIFVNQLSDIMGDWIPEEWMKKILYTIQDLPEHDFIFITKCPQNYAKYKFPDNCILGVTVESPNEWWRAEEVKKYRRTICSVEPILGDFTGKDFSQFEFVVVGCLIGSDDKSNYESVVHPNIYFTR